ncbi:MAG: UvrB/UvrC motif-containing protein, partial [Candidatus Acidiferrales bacterium]
DSMRGALDETERRRAIQLRYNQEHGITPESIVKPVDMALAQIVEADFATVPLEETEFEEFTSEAQVREAIPKLEERMREAAKQFEFERAAQLRDRVRALKQKDIGGFFQPATLPREPLPAELLAPRGTGSTSGKVGRSIRAKARKQRTRKSKHKSRR